MTDGLYAKQAVRIVSPYGDGNGDGNGGSKHPPCDRGYIGGSIHKGYNPSPDDLGYSLRV
ncbi:MAG: hypothetical protein E7587_00740 [Ruminococcaceae bacterium]|nr:hypothetical protein [Oscillospiraceae bacterium]